MRSGPDKNELVAIAKQFLLLLTANRLKIIPLTADKKYPKSLIEGISEIYESVFGGEIDEEFLQGKKIYSIALIDTKDNKNKVIGFARCTIEQDRDQAFYFNLSNVAMSFEERGKRLGHLLLAAVMIRANDIHHKQPLSGFFINAGTEVMEKFYQQPHNVFFEDIFEEQEFDESYEHHDRRVEWSIRSVLPFSAVEINERIEQFKPLPFNEFLLEILQATKKDSLDESVIKHMETQYYFLYGLETDREPLLQELKQQYIEMLTPSSEPSTKKLKTTVFFSAPAQSERKDDDNFEPEPPIKKV